MLYAYPKLSDNKKSLDIGICRLFYGPGLCNLLFPWARTIVASKKYGLKILFPAWIQIHIMPTIRGESDKRIYYDLFEPTEDYIKGIEKMKILLREVKISEKKFLKFKENIKSNKIIIFEGLKNCFSITDEINKELYHNHELILKELLKITKNRHKNGIKYDFQKSICIHVRLGDFKSPKNISRLEEQPRNYRIPMEWYIQQVIKIRHVLSQETPVYVFSDGKDHELAPLLNMKNVKRLSFGSSISDLLALSQSNILIASGSSFSQWASYLGRMPIIWHKGHLKNKLYHEKPNAEIELGKNDHLPETFIKQIKT